MKSKHLSSFVFVACFLLPLSAHSEQTSVPCRDGYSYTCDNNGSCDCEPISDSRIRNTRVEFAITEQEVTATNLREGAFYFALLESGYGDQEAEYISELVNAYDTVFDSVNPDKKFARYLSKKGLAEEEIIVVFDSLFGVVN